MFVAIPGFCGKLLTNGEFESPLFDSWTQIKAGLNIIIDRATSYDPDPDYEAQVSMGTGGGYCKLSQNALIYDMPLNQLQFSVNAKLYAYDNDAEAWAGAAVNVLYINANDSVLGDTKICARSGGCPWTNTSTSHIIAAPNSNWNSYSFTISTELSNLPGVNPSQIRKIGVTLLDTINHC
jgi:hypothetical protein